jgi:hypothetical protein
MDSLSLLYLLEDLPRYIQYINLYNDLNPEEPIILPKNCQLPIETSIASTCLLNGITNNQVSFSYIERPKYPPTINKSKLVIKPKSYIRLLDNSYHYPYISNQEFIPLCLVSVITQYDTQSNQGIAYMSPRDVYVIDAFSVLRKINTIQLGSLYSINLEDCYIDY